MTTHWKPRDWKRVGALLSEVARRNGLSRTMIARYTGLSEGAVGHVLKGRDYPRGIPESAAKIGELMNISIGEVLDGATIDPSSVRPRIGQRGHGAPAHREAILPSIERAERYEDMRIEDLTDEQLDDLNERIKDEKARRHDRRG